VNHGVNKEVDSPTGYATQTYYGCWEKVKHTLDISLKWIRYKYMISC